MYCKKCGKEIDQGTAFCKHCGTRLAEGGSSGSSDIGVMPNHTGSTMSINKLTGLLMAVISLVVVLVVTVLFTPIFTISDNMTNVFLTFVPYACFAIAVAATSSIGKLDLSIGALSSLAGCIFALMASQGNVVGGVLIAILLACAFGVANGFLVSFLRFPSMVITLIIAAVANWISIIITEGTPIPFSHSNPLLPIGVIILIIAIAIGILFLFLSKRTSEQNMAKQKLTSFLPYIASSVLSAIAGIFMTLRVSAAVPSFLSIDTIIFIFLVATILYAAPFFKGHMLQPIIALVPAFIWCVLTNYYNLLGVASYAQGIWVAVFVITMMVATFFTKKNGNPSTIGVPIAIAAAGTAAVTLIPYFMLQVLGV